MNNTKFKNFKYWDGLWQKTFSISTNFGFSLNDKPYLQSLFKNLYFKEGHKGLKILDVGCGANDNFKSEFNDSDSSVVNFDLSHTVLLRLQEKITTGYIPINSKSNFVQGNALNLPFRDNAFDIVLSCQCLHYFCAKEREQVFKEIARVCEKKGYIIIAVKNKYSLVSFFVKLLPSLPLPFHPLTHRNLREELKSLDIIDLFSNIKIPKLKPSSKLNIFLNQRYKRTIVGLLLGLDLVVLAQKVGD